MSDFTLPPRSTMIAGMQGCGKTTFAFRYLLNACTACNFVFDDMGQAAARLHMPHASTAHELEAALATRWVLFNPHRMFPADLQAGFCFFCDWALKASQRGPGKKIILIDEAWRFQNGYAIPPEMAALAQMARADSLELVTCTQVPNRVNASIVGGATEAVIFRLQEANALAKVDEEYQIEPDIVRNLPLGSYIAVNRLSGARLHGRIF